LLLLLQLLLLLLLLPALGRDHFVFRPALLLICCGR
jgi:hypothetical protein